MTEPSGGSSSSQRIEGASFAQPAQEKEQIGLLGTEHTVKKLEESASKKENKGLSPFWTKLKLKNSLVSGALELLPTQLSFFAKG